MFKSIFFATAILISHTGYAGPRKDVRAFHVNTPVVPYEDEQSTGIFGVWIGKLAYFNNGVADGECEATVTVSRNESQVIYSQTLGGGGCYYEVEIPMDIKGTELFIEGKKVGTFTEKGLQFQIVDATYDVKMNITSENKVYFVDHFFYERGGVDSLEGTLERSAIQ